MKEPIVVSETTTSTNHYHLRCVGQEGVRLGGGLSLLGDDGLALCGAKLGWDTQIPVKAYAIHDGYSRWCRHCAAIYNLSLENRKVAV